MTCELVCVPPENIRQVWPKAVEMIAAAMRKGGLSAFAPVEESVLAGKSLLWLAWDGTNVRAAAVTELQQTEWKKACIIVACGGSDINGWINLIHPIEGYAKAEGCQAMRIMGRRGWARVLSNYRVRRYVMEKDL